MNIRSQASEFSIFILTQNADLGARLKLCLSQGGYQAYFIPDIDELMVRVAADPPHIVIFDHQSVVGPLSDLFEKILHVSKEIRLICLTEPEYFTTLKPFQEYNLSAFFDRNQVQVADQVIASVDLICEALFRLYQNEQIHSFYIERVKEVEEIKNNWQHERLSPQIRPFQMRISEYRTAESKEDLLQTFFKQTPTQAWVFLKFIKSIQTYISVLHQNMPESWVEGLSFKIPIQETQFNQKIMVSDFPSSFLNYIKSKWNVEHVKILPLIIKNELEGLLVSTQDIDGNVAEDFSLMSLVYAMKALEAQPLFLDVEDPLTGFYNQLFFKRILDKELDRSKRTFTPASLIKISIDSFAEIESTQGRSFCDEVLVKVSDVIKKTSRLPDYICRTGENEFSILLTNCNRKGAALRAERLRQQMKIESFSKAGLLITVSQGISEYPTLTNSAEALDESSRKALDFISKKGGDKICIYKAAADHEPDFQVSN